MIDNNKYLGSLCRRGHEYMNTGQSIRYVSDNHCVECNIIKANTYREKARIRARAKYKLNKEKENARARKYHADNKDKIAKRKIKYAKAHREQINAYERKRRKENPSVKVSHNMSRYISRNIYNKNWRSWQKLVPYTREELMAHLEKQFKDGMSWDNYGEWHIDHIIPVSVFNFNSYEDIDFKRCWALENLQPLWAEENHKKLAKIDKAFQPSLALF